MTQRHASPCHACCGPCARVADIRCSQPAAEGLTIVVRWIQAGIAVLLDDAHLVPLFEVVRTCEICICYPITSDHSGSTRTLLLDILPLARRSPLCHRLGEDSHEFLFQVNITPMVFTAALVGSRMGDRGRGCRIRHSWFW